jgi:hypothetical protein
MSLFNTRACFACHMAKRNQPHTTASENGAAAKGRAAISVVSSPTINQVGFRTAY